MRTLKESKVARFEILASFLLLPVLARADPSSRRTKNSHHARRNWIKVGSFCCCDDCACTGRRTKPTRESGDANRKTCGPFSPRRDCGSCTRRRGCRSTWSRRGAGSGCVLPNSRCRDPSFWRCPGRSFFFLVPQFMKCATMTALNHAAESNYLWRCLQSSLRRSIKRMKRIGAHRVHHRSFNSSSTLAPWAVQSFVSLFQEGFDALHPLIFFL